MNSPVGPIRCVTRFVGNRCAKLGIGRYRREDLLLVKKPVVDGHMVSARAWPDDAAV